ncbi:MAG TPA: thioredoxin domain-containing protein [Bryobacteraceae bacterium]|nr:thioredoxin domain-containing protein [Bryobacteraceae bacterium]
MKARSALAILALLAPLAALGAGARLTEGNPASTVRVLIFEDLQCPDCAAFHAQLKEKLLPKYGATVAFEHYDFPLNKHVWARKAAMAARFFERMGPQLALKYRDETMAAQQQITMDNFEERLIAFAKANGVDAKQAVAALNEPELTALVEKDVQDGVARGVIHTPTAFVSGTPFVEAIAFEEISKAIDAALKEAGKQ